jgi:UMF1 family MFS transporter
MTTNQVVPTDRKERIAWYLYDFANTSFTVLMVTALFPGFFRNLVTEVARDGGFLGTALWGYAGSITMIIIALTSPILGAIADSSGSKKKFLIVYTIFCIYFNSLLFFTIPNSTAFGIPIWVWAFVIFIIANIGFQGALPFYNAWLPEISDEKTIGRIGGIGFAAGYVGAMLTIIIALISVSIFGTTSTVPFLLGALFFLVFSIPSIMGLKSRPATKKPEEEGMSYIKIGFGRVRKTFGEIREYQGVPLFMVAYFLFSDAITTVIYYAALFGEEVYAFSTTDILIFFAVTQLAAIPGAFIFGYVADRIKTKPTLMITLGIWVVALLIAYFGEAQIIWWIVGMIAGVGMGSAQSTARSMFGQYIPEEKKSEMYGIYALTGKFAAILGPFVYATVLTYSQSIGATLVQAHKNSLLSILIFFVVSLILLVKVRQPVMGMSKTGIEDTMSRLEDDIGPPTV